MKSARSVPIVSETLQRVLVNNLLLARDGIVFKMKKLLT